MNFAAANAGGANPYSLASAMNERMDCLQIQIPATFRHVMSMTDAMPKLWSATTDFTNSCHMYTLVLV